MYEIVHLEFCPFSQRSLKSIEKMYFFSPPGSIFFLCTASLHSLNSVPFTLKSTCGNFLFFFYFLLLRALMTPVSACLSFSFHGAYSVAALYLNSNMIICIRNHCERRTALQDVTLSTHNDCWWKDMIGCPAGKAGQMRKLLGIPLPCKAWHTREGCC